MKDYPYIDGTEIGEGERGFLFVCGDCIDADPDGDVREVDVIYGDLDEAMRHLVEHVRWHGARLDEPDVMVKDHNIIDHDTVRESYQRVLEEAA